MTARLSRATIVALALTACVAAAGVARADDVEQIEKAHKILREASRWAELGAYDHEEAKLKEAEKELEGVDETGKAPVVGEIKDARDKIADEKTRWSSDRVKEAIERTINAIETMATRAGSPEALETGPDDESQNYHGFKQVEEALTTDGWLKAHLDAPMIAELQKKMDWIRKKVTQEVTHGTANRFTPRFNRTINAAEGALESTKDAITRKTDTSPDSWQQSFDRSIQESEELLASDEAKALKPAELAELKKRIETLKTDYAKAKIEVQFNNVQHRIDWIQDVLDGKNTHAYTNNVEDAFKEGAELLEKCPQNDPRVQKDKDRLAQQRKTFDAGQASGAKADVIDPAVKYWPYCLETYKKDSDGWEGETGVTTLVDFRNNELGCPKTVKLLEDVVQRWFGDDRVTKAIGAYANDPAFKPTLDQASALRDKAGQKLLGVAKNVLDLLDKVPEGRERNDYEYTFGNLKNLLGRTTKGCAAHEATCARIDALEKRWKDEKEGAANAKAALDKKMCDSVKAAWPELAKSLIGKAKKIDAPDALANPGSWKGTIVHFSGGARGVDLNRSGWNWQDEYYFIVEKDGVPVCGNLDSGLADAVAEVEKQTGIQADNVEEVIGVLDGVCKAHDRHQNPFNSNEYLKGPPVDAVRMRIIGVRACTICAVVGEGTNLSKLSEYKEVKVSESGSSGSGGGRSHGGGSSGGHGFFHWIHRFIAWGMCALLALCGALAAAHGASKFVPQIQEQKAKLGDYLGYAGAAFGAIGVLWFGAAIVGRVLGMCALGSLPSIAMILAGAFVGADLARSKGKLKEETAVMIQPAGIALGLMCFGAAAVHFFFWDYMLL